MTVASGDYKGVTRVHVAKGRCLRWKSPLEMPPRVAVFGGPSLPREDRVPLPGVTYLPSARRGDVEAAAAAYEIVLLIDGVFHQELAPSPKECYRAAQTARCFGAASMGALRAVECRRYGFAPLGVVAAWYADGSVDGDDEVAVLVDAGSERALTVASVNVRYAAIKAERRGILSPGDAREFASRARDIYYAERSWDRVLAFSPPASRGALEALVARHGDIKRRDARLALAAVTSLRCGLF